MKDKILNIGVAFFSVFHLAILFLAFNPKVTSAYYEYYISKNSVLSPKEVYMVKGLIPGRFYNVDDESIIFNYGWSEKEKNHRWSNDNFSSISFNVLEPDNFKGVLNLEVDTLGLQRISIFINRHQIYSGSIDGLNKKLYFLFEARLLEKGGNIIAFKLPDARKADHGDSRTLALALKLIQIK